MSDLESRVKKLESLIGPVDEPSEFESYHETVQSEIARLALYAVGAACHGLEPNTDGTPLPEAMVAAQAVSDDLKSRFRKEGLLYPPLDEVQLARVREIVAEVKAALPPDPHSGR